MRFLSLGSLRAGGPRAAVYAAVARHPQLRESIVILGRHPAVDLLALVFAMIQDSPR